MAKDFGTMLTNELTERFAAFQPSDVPTAALNSAKYALLDGIGVMMAASGLSPDVDVFSRTGAVPYPWHAAQCHAADGRARQRGDDACAGL